MSELIVRLPQATSLESIFPFGETLRERRGHDFLPSQLIQNSPDLYSTDDVELGDQIVQAHYFSSVGDWYITEIDKESGIAFGHCDLGLGFPEWGYVSLIELEAVESPLGIAAVERDLDFVASMVKDIPELWAIVGNEEGLDPVPTYEIELSGFDNSAHIQPLHQTDGNIEPPCL